MKRSPKRKLHLEANVDHWKLLVPWLGLTLTFALYLYCNTLCNFTIVPPCHFTFCEVELFVQRVRYDKKSVPLNECMEFSSSNEIASPVHRLFDVLMEEVYSYRIMKMYRRWQLHKLDCIHFPF